MGPRNTRENDDLGLVPIDQTAEFQALAKKYPKPKPLTRAEVAFLDAAQAIRADEDAAEKAFLARPLVFCTLPHTEPKDDKPFVRKTGNMTLVVDAGYDPEKGKRYGIPYGILPRLVLYWIVTEAKRKHGDPTEFKRLSPEEQRERRTLNLGDRLNDFLIAIGLNPYTGGGPRSDRKRLKDQMERLFHAKITFLDKGEQGTAQRSSWLDRSVTTAGELWWDVVESEPNQLSLWNSWILLGEVFYADIVKNPVPLDLRALRALKRSPLALDLYAWVCYRAWEILEYKKGAQVATWAQLAQQLGSEYAHAKDFKKAARAALQKIQSVYPGLTITSTEGGFKLMARRLAVPKREPKKLSN
jgi:hypothetical protein